MRTLFLSYSGLLDLIKTEKVTQQELETGLFFFECTREHVNSNPFDESSVNTLPKRFEDEMHIVTARAAVIKAQKEGRVAFRPDRRSSCTFTQLYQLLNRNGVTFRPFREELPQGVADVMELARMSESSALFMDMELFATKLDIIPVFYAKEYAMMLFGHALTVK